MPKFKFVHLNFVSVFRHLYRPQYSVVPYSRGQFWVISHFTYWSI